MSACSASSVPSSGTMMCSNIGLLLLGGSIVGRTTNTDPFESIRLSGEFPFRAWGPLRSASVAPPAEKIYDGPGLYAPRSPHYVPMLVRKMPLQAAWGGFFSNPGGVEKRGERTPR
jgi:hypothetical protein